MEEEKVNTPTEEQQNIAVKEEEEKVVKVEPVEMEPTKMDTDELPVTSTSEQTTTELDAMSELQQLSAANSQLVQAAAAALSGSGNFPFLTNFENLAAMAVAASSNQNTSETPKTNTKAKQQPVDLSQLPADLLKRELMNQKVRADNRERKKRWRQQNEERNKDNDLRCRVNKRAHKLFGKEDSEHKQKWIEEEFKKRQLKRKEKERRKGLVDDSLGAHSQQQEQQQSNNSNNIDLSVISQQNPLSTLSDVNYLQLLCNNLGIPGAARTIIGSVSGNHTQAEEQVQPEPQPEPTNTDKQPFPFQILEILQQLQQYQQPHDQHDQHDFAQQLIDGLPTDKPEEKIAALLASTLQAATAAVAASQLKEEEKTTTSTSAENTTSEEQQEGDQQPNEFPMDAVLTLMQLNAGWRQ